MPDPRPHPEDLRPATVTVSAGRPPREPDAPLNPPITMASTYVATGDVEYGRYGNPTWSAFEDVLGQLEGGRALAFSSGMAAVGTVLDLLGPAAGVVAPRHAYSGTVMALGDLESRGRGRGTLVDIADTEAVIAAMRADEDCALLWIESPTNPALELADIAALAEAAHALGVRVVVDNTFATPLLQQPLALGADIVVHSATKYLAGHSDVQLGALVVADDEVYDAVKGRRDLVGAVPGPFETWLALRGMRTLAVRLDRAQANAAELARRLEDHPAVEEVRYPGLGGIVAMVLRSGDAADVAVRQTRLWVHATSLGGVESTLERRRRWKAEAETIPDGLVRLSVGIEDVEDLWADLSQALEKG
ncbi:PLP-dependent aspartate aminotransferase family protein [Nocardioides panacisoli]|uniref:PLP-dependent transferase n=1 Tax=Nocardioides panacisoli TaxID=627624 RepID=A0ABP7I520_9ACTN